MACLYFDCFSGAAGDMLVASLLDLGASFEALRADLAALRLPGFSLEREKRWQGGLAGTRFSVRLDPGAAPPRRNLHDIEALIRASSLAAPVQRNAIAVFRRLGAAEAKVHGCALEEVHFHEVGAVDSIVDVVGFCALHHRLGSPRIFCSPIAVGEGFIRTEHGLLPVPAMATLELLRGVPVEAGGLREELCTPTGAALLSTLCERFGRELAYVPRAVGYGLGTRERASPPNAIRVVECDVLEPAGEPIVVLATNLDDASGQELARVVERCLAEGALDVTVAPVSMKKGRPGHVIELLAPPARAAVLEELLLRETPTLGVRRHAATRRILPREAVTLATPLGPVQAKAATLPDGSRRVVPEFAELERLAREQALPLGEVRQRIAAALTPPPEPPGR
ncbi:MAG: nickel pincer cofactor biosynthesis protein LarC [Planctomycetes bacterium]|nr:nickel pincer cofactor biosynthesis protein LarC [Planctomycetota bacterium]